MDTNHVGTHLILNVYDAEPLLLMRMDVGLPLLREIVTALDLHVVSETGYQFEPFGYTYAFVLSESHFTIHTYPEFRSCYIDIFCCNKDFDSNKAVALVQKTFVASHVTHQTIKR